MTGRGEAILDAGSGLVPPAAAANGGRATRGGRRSWRQGLSWPLGGGRSRSGRHGRGGGRSVGLDPPRFHRRRIAGLDSSDGLVERLEKRGIGCAVVEPVGYRNDEARMLEQLRAALANL